MWEQHVLIELAPYHGASPCIITNPVIFFIDSGAKTSMSVTACLAPHPFFLLMFWKGTGPKLTESQLRSQISSLSTKNKPCGRMQCKINMGLIEMESSQVSWAAPHTFYTPTDTETLFIVIMRNYSFSSSLFFFSLYIKLNSLGQVFCFYYISV